MSVPVDLSERSVRKKRTLWIGFAIWIVWIAGWGLAAAKWGRTLKYTADAPVSFEARPTTVAASGDRLTVTQVTGWRVQVSRLDPARISPAPQQLDLLQLARRTVRDDRANDQAQKPYEQSTQKPYEQSGPKPYDPKNPKQSPIQQSPVQQSPVQQYSIQQMTAPTSLANAQRPAGDHRVDSSEPPAVSVSPDGGTVAWTIGARLFVAPVDADEAAVRRMAHGGCAPALGSLVLVIACRDGHIEIREPDGSRVRGEILGTKPWTIQELDGDILAISESEVLDISTAGRDYVRLPAPGGVRAVARSRTSLLAVATENGVTLVRPRGGATALNTPGRVDALAFLDDERLLIAGAFSGIHVLRPGGTSDVLIPEVTGVRFVHQLGSERVAYATSDRVGYARVASGMVFTALGYVFLALAALPFIGIIGLIVWAARSKDTLTGADTAAPTAGADQPTVIPLPDPPPGLIRACVDEECVLYAGAGLSAQAGYPTWQPFIEGLLKWSSETGAIDQSHAASLRAALAAGQLDPVADSIVSAVGKPAVMTRLNETFGREERLPSVHRLLKRIPFCAALTANFDTLLERTYPDVVDRVLTPRNAERMVELLGRREFFIGKLYGSLNDPESVVLTGADYSEVISRNLPFSQSMEGLFVSRTLFFIGASLEGIEAYLSGLTFRGQMTRPHYALVAVTDDVWRAKADQLKRRYGIEVMPFTPGPNTEELPRFIERLADGVAKAEEPEQQQTRRSAATEGVRSVRLTNIGPFPDLKLDLQADWNVILGDNGVGKSSILKAIAACFCGQDASPYGSRIIRAGETSGSIQLETARNTYRMELRRKTSGGVEISVVPARPLEVEGILALGFPPLRAVSWERPKGPTSEGQRRPAIEDLLPIVKGDPDPRLDRLKQWIVNLDSRIHYEKTRGGDDRYERLLSRFFEIVDRVTPGMSIGFGHVNQDTREVSVVTDDGEIPIELVSQGSVSLMGWIGVLLQRMYEIYGDEQDPTQRYALVLIDEIDAHMHPEWQQSVVQDMTSIFPNVQFIATTHSPLVVSGMEARQVMRFIREEGRTTRVVVTDEMMLGRADQILTGDLFGMKTTLDQRTLQLVGEYKTLLAKSKRTPEEETEFNRLDRELKLKMPLAEETPPERKAYQLVEAIVNDQMGSVVPGARETVLKKLDELMKELRTRQDKTNATHHV